MLFLRVLTWFGIVAFAGFTSVKGAAVQYAPIKGPNRRLLPAEITGNTSIYNGMYHVLLHHFCFLIEYYSNTN